MSEEDITLQQEIRIIHNKIDYLLEVAPHLHNITQHVSVGKTKGYAFEKSKKAIKDRHEHLNSSIKAILNSDDTEN